MEKLKPCPFCGGNARQVESGRVFCRNCYAEGNSSTSKEQNIKGWNTRTSQWIKNEEEEPQEEGMYLVTDGETVCFGQWGELEEGTTRSIIEQLGAKAIGWMYPSFIGDVLFWQPLPEPPPAEDKP